MEAFLASAFFQALLGALLKAQWTLEVEAEQVVTEGAREERTRVKLRFEHPGRCGFVSAAEDARGFEPAFWQAICNVQGGLVVRQLAALREISQALFEAHQHRR